MLIILVDNNKSIDLIIINQLIFIKNFLIILIIKKII